MNYIKVVLVLQCVTVCAAENRLTYAQVAQGRDEAEISNHDRAVLGGDLHRVDDEGNVIIIGSQNFRQGQGYNNEDPIDDGRGFPAYDPHIIMEIEDKDNPNDLLFDRE